MRRRTVIILSVLSVFVVAAGVVAYRKLSHPSLAPYASLELNPSPPQKGRLQARFLGVATVLLDDGETAIMSDGFFSRPGRWQLLFGEIAPDGQKIDAALKKAGVGNLAAVMTAHSHYDHALDSAEVARRTGAQVVGSESTANIARGAGLPADRIRVVQGGETLTFGRFTITPRKSPHSSGMVYPGEITAPLRPPAKASDYKEGGNYSYLVEHDGRRIIVHASGNFTPGLYAGVRADVVFLGTGGLGKREASFAEDYWRELVTATGARLVVPVHWDDFTLPLDEPLQPMPAAMDDFDLGMKRLLEMAKRDGVAVRLMPAFEPVDILSAADAVPGH